MGKEVSVPYINRVPKYTLLSKRRARPSISQLLGTTQHQDIDKVPSDSSEPISGLTHTSLGF